MKQQKVWRQGQSNSALTFVRTATESTCATSPPVNGFGRHRLTILLSPLCGTRRPSRRRNTPNWSRPSATWPGPREPLALKGSRDKVSASRPGRRCRNERREETDGEPEASAVATG